MDPHLLFLVELKALGRKKLRRQKQSGSIYWACSRQLLECFKIPDLFLQAHHLPDRIPNPHIINFYPNTRPINSHIIRWPWPIPTNSNIQQQEMLLMCQYCPGFFIPNCTTINAKPHILQSTSNPTVSTPVLKRHASISKIIILVAWSEHSAFSV
jgi:hypothetical protein